MGIYEYWKHLFPKLFDTFCEKLILNFIRMDYP